MGPKKGTKDDDSDRSCEIFYARFKKKCQEMGFKPSQQVSDRYQQDYHDNSQNITKFHLFEEMGWQGVKVLFDSLRYANYQHTVSIRLFDTKCEDEGVRAICRYLVNVPSVVVLELLQNEITALGCQFIGSLVNPNNLESKQQLHTLKLDHNPQIGSEGMMYLAEGLRQNKNLVNLSLTYCNIDQRGAHSIFEILLFQGSQLEDIDIGGNRLRNDGTIEVLRGASAAKCLKRLSLQDNQFMEEDDVLDAIQFCMERNQNLGRYNFRYNFIGDYGVERICEMMNISNWVFDVEIPERISKKVMELYQEAKNANKPKKGKKGGKGKKGKKR